MKIHRLAVLATLLATLWAMPAHAQVFDLDDDGEDELYSRGYLSVNFGRTIEDPQDVVVGAEFGERIVDWVDAYLNFSWVRDITTSEQQLRLQEASAAWTLATNRPWLFTGQDQGLTLTYGAKALFPRGSPVRAFAGVGAGGLWIRREITEATLGEITREYSRTYGETDQNVGIGGSYALKPLVEFSVGVSAGAGRLYADVSYKRRRAFRTETRIDFDQFTGSVGVRF
jgi:hypothetical protein